MTKQAFLPDGYELPKSNGAYMKLQDGENRIRILSQPVMGWEDWKDNKPIRFKMADKPTKSIDPKKAVRHWWAFIVWDYADQQIKILHITQAGIKAAITGLCKDVDWGSPYTYDLKILKNGKGMETEYVVNPVPHKAIPAMVKQAFEEKPCNLDALFDNLDPFAPGQHSYTKGVFGDDVAPKHDKDVIAVEAALELDEMLSSCDPSFITDVKKAWAKEGIKSAYQLPIEKYDRVKAVIVKNRDSYQAEMKKKKELENDIGF
jgi:hypothetical protein